MIVETLAYLFIAAIGLMLVSKFNKAPTSSRKVYTRSQMLAYLPTCTAPPSDWKSIESFKKQYQEKLNKPSIRPKTNLKGASFTLPLEDKENIPLQVTNSSFYTASSNKENAVPRESLKEIRRTEDLKLAGQLLHDMENSVMDVKRKLLDNFPLQERKRVPLGCIMNNIMPTLNPDVPEFTPKLQLNPDAPDFRPSYLI
jgi:hypothetical protein